MIDVDHQSSGRLGRAARGHVAHIAPSRASSSTSRFENPSSARRSSVSAPSTGGGDAGAGSPLASRKPDRTTRTGRSTSGTRFECLEQSALDDLRMFEHRGHVEDLARGHSIMRMMIAR